MKACQVTFSVGDRSKTLWIFGPRYWKHSLLGQWSITDPEPFSRMPIIYENSFGGPGYDRNPVGKGYISNLKGNDKHDPQARALPNIEDTRELVATPHSKIFPPGFGPLDRMWQPRIQLAGTLDKTWLEKNWPDPPGDFDWGYFNAAPRDMQVEGYLRGDEELYFENLHAGISTYRSRMPGVRARCFVVAKTEAQARIREVSMNLDTLWVDMPAERLVLVWRGVTPVRSFDFKDIDEVLVVAEDLGVEKRNGEFYFSRHRSDQDKTEQIDDQWVSSEAEEKDHQGQDDNSTEQGNAADLALDAQVEKGLDQARELLKQSQADPELIHSLEAEKDPEAFLQTLMTGLNMDTGQGDKIREQTKLGLRNLLSSQGEDPSIIDELFPPENQVPLSDAASNRSAMLQEMAAAGPDNRKFSGRDLSGLDLSGMDLKGADFKGATLNGSTFRKTDLSGADFSQASLEYADFSQAVLRNVSFAQADLTAAKFISADLREADLSQAVLARVNATGADFSQADLSGAVLEGGNFEEAVLRQVRAEAADFSNARLNQADLRVALLDGALFANAQLRQALLDEASGPGGIFSGADLSDARFTKGRFADANFADAKMDRTLLATCDLSQATFERAQGVNVNMSGSNLTGAKVGEGAGFPNGDFRKIVAPRSIWTDAGLETADFSGGQLERADFSRARLAKARFQGVRSRFANFDSSILKAADFHEADLFMTNFTRADMEECNLSGGNFYGAEFLEANFLKTNIQSANLTMTKLAGR